MPRKRSRDVTCKKTQDMISACRAGSGLVVNHRPSKWKGTSTIYTLCRIGGPNEVELRLTRRLSALRHQEQGLSHWAGDSNVPALYVPPSLSASKRRRMENRDRSYVKNVILVRKPQFFKRNRNFERIRRRRLYRISQTFIRHVL